MTRYFRNVVSAVEAIGSGNERGGCDFVENDAAFVMKRATFPSESFLRTATLSLRLAQGPQSRLLGCGTSRFGEGAKEEELKGV